MLTNEECFEAWAPDNALWSQWAKPILFAQLGWTRQSAPSQGGYTIDQLTVDVSWAPTPRGDTAIIVELPGAESVRVGFALARIGYRPVPLYNASDGPSPVIEVDPIIDGLLVGAELLRELDLRPEAPPAFLLDADRMRPRMPPGPGRFDNRWLVFPQDFPSATLLHARGIHEVLLAQKGEDAPQEDLAHVLLRWRNGGIRLLAVDVQQGRRPRDLLVRPPSLFRRAWYRAIAIMGLRRNNAGGFGGAIPLPSSGGGYG